MQPTNDRIVFRQPAERWREATPAGNGFAGMMISGHPFRETIPLTELTCFSGEPGIHPPENAPFQWQAARDALLRGDFDAATAHVRRFHGDRGNYGTHLPTGQLELCWHWPEDTVFSHYVRTLDLAEACITTVYDIHGIQVHAEAFASHPHRVMALRYQTDKGILPPLSLSLSSHCPHTVSSEDHRLEMQGQALETVHSDGTCGVFWCITLMAISDGQPVLSEGGVLNISSASDVTLLLAVSTSLDDPSMPHSHDAWLRTAASLGFDALRRAHVEDYAPLYHRCRFSLDDAAMPDCASELPALWDNPAMARRLSVWLFQLGRYLLLCSSREDSPLPAPLQGVWNDHVASRIGWTCDMHLNINTQMNYWPAEITGLPECHTPLLRWICDTLVPRGRVSAQAFYGLPGWTAELVSNAWGFTGPYWHPNLSPSPTCGIWIALHLYEHALHLEDPHLEFSRILPVFLESAAFFLSWMTPDPAKPELLTFGPAVSSENAFVSGGKTYTLSMAPAGDVVMIRALFSAIVHMCHETGSQPDLHSAVIQALRRLPPDRILPDGSLAEWSHDFPSHDPQHRHTSHLLGLFPLSQITPEDTPALAEAAARSITLRTHPPEGWEDTGWARNLLLAYSARLQDCEAAQAHLMAIFRHLTQPGLLVRHPPTRGAPAFDDVYELDGNTGLTAAVAEMLMQSHRGDIHLLPCLPPFWHSGHISGLRARGGVTVAVTWKNGILTQATLTGNPRKPVHVRWGNHTVTVTLETSLTLTPGDFGDAV